MGSLGPQSLEALILGAVQLQILVIWGPYEPPVVVALETQAEILKTAGARCARMRGIQINPPFQWWQVKEDQNSEILRAVVHMKSFPFSSHCACVYFLFSRNIGLPRYNHFSLDAWKSHTRIIREHGSVSRGMERKAGLCSCRNSHFFHQV